MGATSTGVSQNPSLRLPITHWKDRNTLPSQSWLIKGVIGEGGFSAIVGASGTLKTFLVLDIGMHAAQGKPWFGKKVKQGAVLYVAAEGGRSAVQRLDAYAKHYGLDPDSIPFYILPQAIDIRSAEVNRLLVDIQSMNVQFSLIIFDTFSRCLAGADENSPVDVGQAIRSCDQIRGSLGTHVLLVHHLGKNQAQGARGHSALPAAVDTELRTQKSMTGVALTVQKQRDGADGAKFSFSKIVVDLGLDEDDDPVTSLVVVPVETTKGAAVAELDDLKNSERVALEALRHLARKAAPSNEGSARIPIRDWSALSAENGISPKASKGEGNVKDAIRVTFDRARRALAEQGYVALEGDSASLVGLGASHSNNRTP